MVVNVHIFGTILEITRVQTICETIQEITTGNLTDEGSVPLAAKAHQCVEK